MVVRTRVTVGTRESRSTLILCRSAVTGLFHISHFTRTNQEVYVIFMSECVVRFSGRLARAEEGDPVMCVCSRPTSAAVEDPFSSKTIAGRISFAVPTGLVTFLPFPGTDQRDYPR